MCLAKVEERYETPQSGWGIKVLKRTFGLLQTPFMGARLKENVWYQAATGKNLPAEEEFEYYPQGWHVLVGTFPPGSCTFIRGVLYAVVEYRNAHTRGPDKTTWLASSEDPSVAVQCVVAPEIRVHSVYESLKPALAEVKSLIQSTEKGDE